MKNDNKINKENEYSSYKVFKRLLALSKNELRNISFGLVALVVNSITNLSFPWIMGKTVDRLFIDGENENKFYFTTAALLFTGSLASWIRVYYLGLANENIVNNLRIELFESFMDKKLQLETNSNIGENLYALEKDTIEASKVFTETLASGLRSLNSSMNGSVLLYLTSPQLSLVSLSIVPLVGFSAMGMSKRAKKYIEKSKSLESNITSYTIERLSKLTTVKFNGKEDYEKKTYRKLVSDSSVLSASKFSSQSSFMAFINLSSNVSLFAVLYIGGGMIKQGLLSTGDLTRFAIQSAFVGLGFSGLSSSFSDLRKGLDAASRIFIIIDKNLSSKDFKSKDIIHSNLIGEVVLRNVSFYYSSRPNNLILNNITLRVKPNSIVSFVGKSGSGKSTLLSLLNGLNSQTSGLILINGIDISNKHYSCHDIGVGVVEQSSNLLSGTIAFNISYGMENAVKEDIIEASELACSHSFIKEFPDGYDTVIGENGKSLSGGQQMKIALARAIIKKPNILLLDEVTAALDLNSEMEVALIIKRLKSLMTVIIVTHSTEFIAISDVIYNLENGVIQQSENNTNS